jgi:hypothetical protein
VAIVALGSLLLATQIDPLLRQGHMPTKATATISLDGKVRFSWRSLMLYLAMNKGRTFHILCPRYTARAIWVSEELPRNDFTLTALAKTPNCHYS